MMKGMKGLPLALGAAGLLCAGTAAAATVNLDQAVKMALAHDPRITEQQKVADNARALLREAQANRGLRVSANLFEGLSPAVHGGFNGASGQPRTDGGSLHGVSDWTDLEFSIIKPLYTFGKIEHYSEAAKNNIKVKEQDVRLQREQTAFDVKRAYYGYLTARDTRLLLEDLKEKVDGAADMVSGWVKADNGQAKQSDLYAIQAAQGLLNEYLEQAGAIEKVALDGLKVLTGVGLKGDLEVADAHIAPVALPPDSLEDFQKQAVTYRPEMAQLAAGLKARRELVEARRADGKPNIYAGVAGSYAYSSNRDRLNNPYVYDPFNHGGATPVVGIQWEFTQGVTPARVAQAQADLDALVAKNEFAEAGIPFQVSENYNNMMAAYRASQSLKQGSMAARRWMVSAYADFSAGLEKAAAVSDALKTYALTSTDYLKSVNDYNTAVAKMARLTGHDD